MEAVELSALRVDELTPLVEALPTLDLSSFSFVSVHAPSKFAADLETRVVDQLRHFAESGYPVVVHPDVIQNPDRWRVLGSRLLSARVLDLGNSHNSGCPGFPPVFLGFAVFRCRSFPGSALHRECF